MLAAAGAAVAAGVGAMLLSLAFPGHVSVSRTGPNVPVNAGAGDLLDISAQNSPTLVRNPVDGANLAIADRIDSPRFACALHISHDRGATWSPTPIRLPRARAPKCYAPDVAFGADGTLYVSFVTLSGLGNVPGAAWIVSSRDGGRTLGAPVRVLGPLTFQLRLVADPVVPRRLYLVWLKASGVGLLQLTRTGNPIVMSRSDDGGATWRPPARVSDPSLPRVDAGSLAVGPRGQLSVLYLDLGDDRLDYAGAHAGQDGPPYQGAWRLVLARSRDGGSTWTQSLVEPSLVPTERFIVFIPPFPSLAADPRSDRLYAAFQDGRLGDSDVRLWTSTDAGESWRAGGRVNDTPPRDRTSQYLPRLAVAPDGRLDVIYYDRRADPRNVDDDVTLQSSFDEGRSFTGALRLTDRSFDARIGSGLAGLGSRLALLSTDSGALAVWSDTRAGTSVSHKQDLARQLVSVDRAARLSPPLRSALRYGGLAVGVIGLILLFAAATDRRRGPARDAARAEASSSDG